MADGLMQATTEGTPQGSPLSPLLSNVMLDDLDWELERRGHRFVRYADDGRVYVHSRREGERVMASITHYVEDRLKLRVNREKSVVARSLRRPFLGFCLRPRMGEVRVLVDPKALKRAKGRLRALTSRRWGVSMERRIKEINRFTVGWSGLFQVGQTPPDPVRGPRRMAPTPDYGKCDGRNGSAPAHGGTTCECSVSPKRTPGQWASSQQGILAHRRIQSPRHSRYPTGTGPDLWPAGILRPLPPFPGMLSEPAGCGPARPVVWGAPG